MNDPTPRPAPAQDAAPAIPCLGFIYRDDVRRFETRLRSVSRVTADSHANQVHLEAARRSVAGLGRGEA